MLSSIICLASAFATATAGPVLWDGRFNGMASSAPLAKWTWDNLLPPYQDYRRGTGAISEYINLSPSYKNPADASSAQGARFTIDNTSHYWETPEFQTVLLPQPYNVSAITINTGKVYYHFSLRLVTADSTKAHTLFHFPGLWTGMTYGPGETLSWLAANQSRWSTTLAQGVWHNFAYAIDFSSGSVALLHSTAGAGLEHVAGPYDVAASSDGMDFHVGVVRAANPNGDLGECQTELWDVSGVYIEGGPVSTAISGPGGVDKREIQSAVRVEAPRGSLVVRAEDGGYTTASVSEPWNTTAVHVTLVTEVVGSSKAVLSYAKSSYANDTRTIASGSGSAPKTALYI